MKTTTKETFQNDVINEKKVVLVDVWAPWCGPCRGMMPILEAIAEETQDWAEVVKLEASENSDALINQLGVMSLPSFLIFKNGQIADMLVGAVPKIALVDAMKKIK